MSWKSLDLWPRRSFSWQERRNPNPCAPPTLNLPSDCWLAESPLGAPQAVAFQTSTVASAAVVECTPPKKSCHTPTPFLHTHTHTLGFHLHLMSFHTTGLAQCGYRRTYVCCERTPNLTCLSLRLLYIFVYLQCFFEITASFFLFFI